MLDCASNNAMLTTMSSLARVLHFKSAMRLQVEDYLMLFLAVCNQLLQTSPH